MSPSPLEGDTDEVFRRWISLLVVVWVMFLLTAALMYDAALSIKHLSWSAPEYFIHICEGVIFSAVFLLTTTTSGVIRAYLTAKKPDK